MFRDDVDRVDFGRQLGVGHERFQVEIHAYCLMSNHFHLLVHCPAGNLSEFMHIVSTTFARHCNDRLGRDGPIFRGRFHAVPVDSDAHVLTAVRYIHRNPLDITGVDSVEAFRWSSHRTYLGHRSPPTWMRTDRVLDSFGGDIAAFHMFVADQDTCPTGVAGDDITPMIDLVLDEVGFGDQLSTRAARRAVEVFLGERLDDHHRVALLPGLAARGSVSHRAALSRARRHAAIEPSIGAATRRILRFVV